MENTNLMIREIFSILTQGVEVKQYDVERKTNLARVGTKIIWMDSDIYRVCVDSIRPSLAERASGKVPIGLYLRDISEVRVGISAHYFRINSIEPADPETCLTLIGSERSISLELPSKFTRDWFLKRFRLLANDILVDQERANRKFKLDNMRILNENEISKVHDLEALLIRGVQTIRHYGGKAEHSLLRYDVNANMLVAHPMLKSAINNASMRVLHLDDISEIRCGTHSVGFVKSCSVHLEEQCLSIVGSEGSLDLEFLNRPTRDVFAERLFDFAVFHHPSYSATSSQTAKEQLLRQDSIDPLDIQNTVDEQGAQTVVASGGSEQTI